MGWDRAFLYNYLRSSDNLISLRSPGEVFHWVGVAVVLSRVGSEGIPAAGMYLVLRRWI